MSDALTFKQKELILRDAILGVRRPHMNAAEAAWRRQCVRNTLRAVKAGCMPEIPFDPTYGEEGGGAHAAPGPVEMATDDLSARIDHAARETETNPTDAQREAGNYRKGRVKVHGLEIVIENPKGSIRRGRGADGKEWSREMAHHYGYIRTTDLEREPAGG